MKNFLPIFVSKIFQNGELNNIILRLRSFILLCWFLFPLSWWYIRLSQKALLFKDFLYSALNLSNMSLHDEFSDNFLLMDFGRCFNIWSGWFELISISINLSDCCLVLWTVCKNQFSNLMLNWESLQMQCLLLPSLARTS